MADVLVVDDDCDMADLLVELLQSPAHGVRVARDGREALELVAQRRPDLVLLDVEMPLVSGPEMVAGMLIRDCGDERIPVVLLSGVLDRARVAARVGTPYFLPKPYTLDALLAVVSLALEQRVPPTPKALGS
jgi:DNA-binding NtrC family response regulator